MTYGPSPTDTVIFHFRSFNHEGDRNSEVSRYEQGKEEVQREEKHIGGAYVDVSTSLGKNEHKRARVIEREQRRGCTRA